MPEQPAPGAPRAQPKAPEIDVQKLADRVYQLLLADARLSRSRSDVPLPPARMGEG